MSVFTVEADPEASLYLRMSDRPVARTVEVETDRVWVDLDESGEPIGIEILDGRVDVSEALALASVAAQRVAKTFGRPDISFV